MAVDDQHLAELLEESQDLQADATRAGRATFDPDRRRALRRLGLGGAGLACGGVLQGLLGAPARADVALDIQILQTASSLERLAVDTYTGAVAANLAGIATLEGSAGQVVKDLFLTTARRHDEHRKAFQAQTAALGGPVQDAPNPKFGAIVASRIARAQTPVDVLDLAAILEKVATDTYLGNLSALEDLKAKGITAGVMGVEAQHLAVLRAVAALLRAGTPDLVRNPLGTRLPPTAVAAAVPDALERVNPPELLAQPETGAIR